MPEFPGRSKGRVGVREWMVQREEAPIAILPATHTTRTFWQLWMWTLVSTGPRTTVLSWHLSTLTDLKEHIQPKKEDELCVKNNTTSTTGSQAYLRGDRRYMKALAHLWILMLAPVSLSEVLARVCFKTWDISTILLPAGAMWVFLAILALFMAPSTGMNKYTQVVKEMQTTKTIRKH